MKETVLVTGISGYIAAHVARVLLERGFAVRGTVRSQEKADRVKAELAAAGSDITKLSFVQLDLEHDEGWNAAAKGCAYVQHLASPFPLEQPRGREDLVPAARAGAQRALAAGFGAGAKRIVLTSSMVAMMGYPSETGHEVITEDSWSDPEWKMLSPYYVSKTRAELSAWEYAKAQGFEDRLCVVNPGLVLGPAVGASYGTSLELISQMMKGEFPRVPNVSLAIVDVRDLAEIHVEAMLRGELAARRLLSANETLWLSELADVLRREFPGYAAKLPKGTVPNFVIRLASLFDDKLKSVRGSLGVFHKADSAYVTQLTGVKFRPAEQSIIDTVKYLQAQGVI